MKKSRLLFLLLLAFMVLLAACEGNNSANGTDPANSNTNSENTSEDTPKDNPNQPKGEMTYTQAPELAELVKSGELPPLSERLPVPEDIMVEKVQDEIGQYGGDWTLPWKGADDKWTVGKPTEEPLFRFSKDGSHVEPNVAKGYEVNDDSTVYTIHLREGMKWSDGVPFTADDVLFYWNHMLVKETFGKKLYDCYYSVNPDTGERTRAEVKKVDDYTFTVTFKDPNVLFLERLAIDNKWMYMPAHFQKTILPEFVGEEKTLEIAKQWGYSDVKSFLKATGYYFWIHPEIPTLRAWHASNDPNSDQFIMERNPYYFKVDAEGHQLPYIDRIVATRIQDDSQRVLGALAGDYNLLNFNFSQFTVLKENEKKADFRVIPWTTPTWSSTTVQLNQTYPDDNLRGLFQDIRFREALSVAVDRKEISEIVTNGLGKPQQASVPKGLVGYQEGWADKWTDFDPDRANELLDEIGLTKRDSDGFRLFPDGSDVVLTFVQGNTIQQKFLELIKKYYEDIGIKVNLKYVDPGTHHEMVYSNQIAATAENISLVNVAFRPDTVVPLRVLTPWYGNYGLYTQSGGKEGPKPTGDIAKILEYWDKIKASTSSDEIKKWSNEIIKLHMKNQWIIGYTGPTPVLVVASNKMHNIPTDLVYADEFRDLGHGHPAQFFIK